MVEQWKFHRMISTCKGIHLNSTRRAKLAVQCLIPSIPSAEAWNGQVRNLSIELKSIMHKGFKTKHLQDKAQRNRFRSDQAVRSPSHPKKVLIKFQALKRVTHHKTVTI